MNLIERLRDPGTEVSREECADEIERLTAEIDKNGELLRYVEGLETMNCARIRELQAKNSALADEVGDYAKENVVLTAERDALKHNAAKFEARYERVLDQNSDLKAALQLIKANTNTADWPDDINTAIQGAGK